MEANNIFDVLEFLNKEKYDNARIAFWDITEDLCIGDIFGHINTNNRAQIPKGPYLFIWPRNDNDDAIRLWDILEPNYDVKLHDDERVLIYPIPKVIES